MKQLFQNLKNGKIEIMEIPMPNLKKDHLIIKSINSLISKGTEKMLLEFGKSSLFSKALEQPDRVKEVINKISTEGLYTTYNKVKNKLDEPIPMGYCNVGVVVESGCDEFKVGDRVVSNGNHAEIVIVPKNLCSLIPDNVSDDDASFTVLSSIALNGIRLIKPEIGDTVVVYGLGLIGLISCQLLINAGCNVIGIDVNEKLTSIASKFGVNTICSSDKNEKLNFVNSFTKNYGADSVIISAASKKDDIINESGSMTRKKGSIVLIGVVNLNINRNIFYKKEITFQVSSSYGPGRYEKDLFLNNTEIPPHILRWNVTRNFDACLNLISKDKLSFKNLITHKFNFKDYKKSYDLINKDDFSLGIILKYSNQEKPLNTKTINLNPVNKTYQDKNKVININFIGSGNYAKSTLMPLFKKYKNIKFGKLISYTGTFSSFYGKKFNFETISTDIDEPFQDDSNLIIISTQHDSHAQLVCRALKSKKNVYVEKPLCLNEQELELIKKNYYDAKKSNPELKILVGFNRRFSPHITKAKKIIDKSSNPLSFNITINSGSIDKQHWINDPLKGGGRLIGEACHFIDLARFIVGEKIVYFSKNVMRNDLKDTFSISLKFIDGSIGTINYFSNGNRSYPKEKIEIFSEGKILVINNFKNNNIYDSKFRIPSKSLKQDKGQENMIKLFIESIEKNKTDIIPIDELFEIAALSIQIDEKET